jgi:hypothetical protein
MKRDGRLLDHRTLEGYGTANAVNGGGIVRLQSHDDLPRAQRGGKAGCGTESAALQAGDRTAPQFDAAPGASSVSLDQRL